MIVDLKHGDQLALFFCFTILSQGDSIQTCQGDGTWSGTQPVCVGEFMCKIDDIWKSAGHHFTISYFCFKALTDSVGTFLYSIDDHL